MAGMQSRQPAGLVELLPSIAFGFDMDGSHHVVQPRIGAVVLGQVVTAKAALVTQEMGLCIAILQPRVMQWSGRQIPKMMVRVDDGQIVQFHGAAYSKCDWSCARRNSHKVDSRGT